VQVGPKALKGGFAESSQRSPTCCMYALWPEQDAVLRTYGACPGSGRRQKAWGTNGRAALRCAVLCSSPQRLAPGRVTDDGGGGRGSTRADEGGSQDERRGRCARTTAAVAGNSSKHPTTGQRQRGGRGSAGGGEGGGGRGEGGLGGTRRKGRDGGCLWGVFWLSKHVDAPPSCSLSARDLPNSLPGSISEPGLSDDGGGNSTGGSNDGARGCRLSSAQGISF